MRFTLALAAAGVVAATVSANAGTIDLTDGIFTQTMAGPLPTTPLQFTETDAGVTFTFTATNNLVGGLRFIGLNGANGIQVGGGGGSSRQFEIMVSHNVTLDSYTTTNGIFAPGTLEFDIFENFIAPFNSVSPINPINPAPTGDVIGGAFNAAPVMLTAGTTYVVPILNGSAGVAAFISSIDFTQNSTPTPVPATLALAAGGLLSLGVVARRRSNLS